MGLLELNDVIPWQQCVKYIGRNSTFLQVALMINRTRSKSAA